jgi:hypothetical protein
MEHTSISSTAFGNLSDVTIHGVLKKQCFLIFFLQLHVKILEIIVLKNENFYKVAPIYTGIPMLVKSTIFSFFVINSIVKTQLPF